MVGLINSTGEIVNSYKYDSFRNTVEAVEKVQNRFRYAGDPYPTGYATTESALKRTGNDATKIFEGLQVGPWDLPEEFIHLSGYKQTLMPYEMVEDIPAAFGITKANPHFGSGGLPQVYVDKFNDLVKAGRIRPIPDKKIPLKNWHVKPDDVKGIYSRVPKP